jgi:hypothetical protein
LLKLINYLQVKAIDVFLIGNNSKINKKSQRLYASNATNTKLWLATIYKV